MSGFSNGSLHLSLKANQDHLSAQNYDVVAEKGSRSSGGGSGGGSRQTKAEEIRTTVIFEGVPDFHHVLGLTQIVPE